MTTIRKILSGLPELEGLSVSVEDCLRLLAESGMRASPDAPIPPPLAVVLSPLLRSWLREALDLLPGFMEAQELSPGLSFEEFRSSLPAKPTN